MFDQDKYIAVFSQVHASEETLTEVLKMTKRQKNHYGARLTRALVIAAVVSAMLATTAFAYVGFTQYENPMEMLKTFFGGDEYTVIEGVDYTYDYYGYIKEYHEPTVEWVPVDEKVAEEVAPFIGSVGESVTSDGYTLTVKAHQYDSVTDCGIIYYTLENPDGVTGYKLQTWGEIWWPGGEKVIGPGENVIIEDETTDTCLSVAHYYVLMNEREEMVELCLNRDQTLTLRLDDGGGMDGAALGNGALKLSAIGIRIDMQKLGICEPGSWVHQLLIRYQDGTEYIVDNSGEGDLIMNYTYAVSYDGEIGFTFNRLVDIDSVAAVVINGVECTDIREITDEERAEFPYYVPSDDPPVTMPVD